MDHRAGDRGRPGPPKMPLADFLKEFEDRLRQSPDSAATSAGEILEERAAGKRRFSMESAPSPVGAGPAGPDESGHAYETAQETADSATGDGIATGGDAGEAATPVVGGDDSAAETEGRRHRRRRHKHRRHGH